MKKTVTANIAGTVFHIEEDAYEQLQRYLAGIRANFSGSTGAKEIMADIESRIAELFSERLQGRDVVTPADVEHVMAVMGQPEDFADGAAGTAENATASSESTGQGRRYKRFFRDSDDKWVGGVLGGVAAYIGMDPLWLRIAMIVLVWASVGVLIPMYILLWILVPRAETAADRLQMRGEAVTVENIKRVVEEGAEKVKQGGARFASEAQDLGNEWTKGAARRKSQIGEVVVKLIGVMLIVIAFSALLSLITGLVGGTFSIWHSTWSSEDLGLLDLGGILFNSQQHALWFAIGVFTLIAVPIIALFLIGFRLLLETRTPKWLGWTLGLLWLAALVPTIVGAMDLARDFHRENSVRTEEPLEQPLDGVLYLDALDPTEENESWSVRFDNGDVDVDMDGLHVENGIVFGAWARLDVERSADSLYHLVVVREAHGSSAKAALTRAEEIQYTVQQQGEVLLVSPVMSYSTANKFRAQDVHFTLEVPLGKSIFLRPGSKAVIYDIDNVTNTYDGDMIGRTWTMTAHGLEDPNAPLREDKSKREEKEEETKSTSTDSTTAKKVAATVWRRPTPKKAPARADAEAMELPSLLSLLKPHMGN